MNAMAKERQAMLDAAAKYTTACNALQDAQKVKIREDHAVVVAGKTRADGTKVDEKELSDRLTKIELCNDVIDLGNEIRVGNWKGQTMRDTALLHETAKKFDLVNAKLDELKNITIRKPTSSRSTTFASPPRPITTP